MSKKLLWAVSSVFTFFLFSGSLNAQTHTELFDIPPSVCAGAYIYPENIVEGAQNYSWSFCPPNLIDPPDGFTTDSLPYLLNGKALAIVSLDSVSFSFHINENGNLIRSRYEDGLESDPFNILSIANNLTDVGGMTLIQDADAVYHMFIVSGTIENDSKLIRVDFGNGIQADPTALVNVGDLSILNGPRQIFIAADQGVWYGFTFTRQGHLLKLNFGSNLLSAPHITDLGNIDGQFNRVSGLAAIREIDNWHLLVTNYTTSNLVRISFGNSLNNTPFVINHGTLGSRLQRPTGIAITKGCEAYYGFVVNEGTNNLVTLKWDGQSIANTPLSIIQGNIAGFHGPQALSTLTDENGTLFLYAINANNRFSKMMFRACNEVNIAHSSEQVPPPFRYNTPGNYSIYLTINQGLPNVQTVCHTISVTPHPNITLSNDTLICQGDEIELHAIAFGTDSIVWSPNYNIDTLYGSIVNVAPDNATKYVPTFYFGGDCIVPDTIHVLVSKSKADAGPDQLIQDGASTMIGGAETTLGPQYTYQWTPTVGITGSAGEPVTAVTPPFSITYYLEVANSDGCRAVDSVNIRIPCDAIHLPNAFSPESGNSQINKFGILNQQLAKVNYFKIYDRWGKEVFTTTNPNERWDGRYPSGKEAPMGVYVWEVDANCANTGERYTSHGSVTLIR